ncbi:MFS transporter [Streptomyces sp. NPDC007095]|uniref:MFS transporter n=1 Tax=Streptomyces sp. NPDC007095 TaxID=3154482 RepID=UPI00340E1615
MSSPRPLRANRDFLLLWTGAGLAFVGSRISTVAYPMLVLAYTGSASDAGIVGFFANLPYLLQLAGGVLADRVDRRRLMIVCDLGRIIAVTTLIAAVAGGRFWLPQVACVAFCDNGLAILYRIAERASVRNLVRDDDLPVALSRNEARQRGAGLIGAPIGSFLFALARWAPFVSTLASSLASLVSLMMIRTKFQTERVKAPRRSMVADLRAGLAWAWHQPIVRVIALLIAGSNMLFAALTLSLQYIVRNEHSSAAEAGVAIGVIFGISGVGGLLGALNAAWWTRVASLPALVIGCNAVWAVLMPMVAVVRSPVGLGALFAGMGYAGALWNVAAAAYQQRVTPDELQGRLLSVAILVAYGTVPLGSMAGGFLLNSWGAVHTVLALGACMAGLAVWTALSPAIRELATAPHDLASQT